MKPVSIYISVSLTLFLPFSIYADDAIELQTISVTASRTPVSLNATGSAITVITEQDLHDRQQPFVVDVLRAVPGVTVSQTGGRGQLAQVRMRGSEADHVLVIIDGIKLNPGSGDGVNVAHLLTADVDRIEILRGSQSVLWGSDAIGGVIAITTRRGRSGATRVNLALQEGSFNSSEASASISGGNQNTRYALNLSRITTDGFSAADDDTFNYILPDGSRVQQGGSGVEDDAYENRNIAATFKHKFSHDLSVEAALREINYDVTTDSFSGGEGVVDNNIPGTSSRGLYAQTTLRFSQLDGLLQHSVKVADSDLDDTFISSFGDSSARTKKRQYGYQLDFFLPQAKDSNNSHSITLAIEREDNSNDSTFSGLQENSTSSTIAEYRYDFGERLSSAIAYRHDNNNIFNNSDIGHASLSYEINTKLRLHSSAGTGIKNPTLSQLYGSSENYPGNRALRPETSESVDAGVQWQIKPQQMIDTTLFILRIEDQIIGAGNTSSNVGGRTKTSGLEVSYQATLGAQWSLAGQLTLQNGEDAKGNELVRRPETIASINATQRSFVGKLSTMLSINYNGSQFDYYFDPAFNRLLVQVKSYTLVNLASRYRLNDRVELVARIENLLDETYQEVIGYGTSPRAYYLGLRAKI